MIKTAHYLAKQLGQQDPTHKADFQKNANKYIASLKPIQSLITQISKKSNGHAVAQTEPVFEYMLKAMGYHVMDSDFLRQLRRVMILHPQHWRRSSQLSRTTKSLYCQQQANIKHNCQ